MVSGVTDENMR